MRERPHPKEENFSFVTSLDGLANPSPPEAEGELELGLNGVRR
jgi:hypothetical protein